MNKVTSVFSFKTADRKSDAGASVNPQRIVSIDILRALTMLLMIFVNDFWTLKDVPFWMLHRKFGVDGIGLSDVVFPAFLFIVGLSLPYALENRRKKGDSTLQIAFHILLRTAALLIMGVFLVNGETYNAAATGFPGWAYAITICVSFIAIWNTYPDSLSRIIPLVIRVAAFAVLITLAVVYRGGHDEHIHRFGPQWWGILGLIGWAYLASALVTLLSGNRFLIIFGGWIFFCLLSILYKAGIIPHQSVLNIIPNAILGGTLAGLTMGGVLASWIFRYFVAKKENLKLTVVLLLFAGLLFILSVLTHPYWGLTKLGATPAWLFLCSSITIVAFLIIYWIADVYGKANWFGLIKPAGTATILCYLVPDIVYAIRGITAIRLPELMVTGGIGLIKSFLYALMCVIITGLLIRLGVRMKL
jgi:heparan-alpha-glucosaminide N-acetyltransferase